MNPVIIDSEDDVEISVVELLFSSSRIRIINLYDPHEDAHVNEKEIFWRKLEEEIQKSKDSGSMTLIEFDANAKLDNNIIKNNPNNTTSSNGKYLLDLVERNNLIICNSHELCKGTVKRQRIFEKKKEESVIDYLLVCEDLEPFFKELIIDEEKIHSLFRCTKTKNGEKTIYSDHNMLISNFSLHYEPVKNERNEVFNFKCSQGKQIFFNSTNNTNKFTRCLEAEGNIKEKSQEFFECIQSTIKKSFNKFFFIKLIVLKMKKNPS